MTPPDNGYLHAHAVRLERHVASKKEIAGSATLAVLLAGYVEKYRLTNVSGMTLADLADPDLPWEVFFWTAR